MSVPAPWLATFVEQCLGFYLGNTAHNGIEVEDDGATLSFRKPELTSVAAISEVCPLFLYTRYQRADRLTGFYQWGLGSSHDSACLMDADNQILAMFPHDLSDPKILPANPHSKETNPRKHQIELLDFALVFTYSTSTPDVHLNVNRFRINWQEGTIQGLTPTKKLRRNRTVKLLLDKAFQEAKSKKVTARSTGPWIPLAKSPRPGDQHFSQSETGHHHDTQSQQIFSQMPAHNQDASPHTVNMERSRQHGADELLHHLNPSSRPSSRNAVGLSTHLKDQGTRSSATRNPLQVLADGEPTANESRRSASPLEDGSEGEDSISSQPQYTNIISCRDLEANSPQTAKLGSPQVFRPGTTSALLDPGERADAQSPSSVAARSPSRKRHRESAEVQPEHGHSDSHSFRQAQEIAPNSPTRKRPRITDTILQKSPGDPVTPNYPATEVSNLMRSNQESGLSSKLATDPPPLARNPWQGLTGIPASDVKIPKDQLELLDGNLCWIPPSAGDPEPRGHVPAWLLQQWNNIARLRHRRNQADSPLQELEKRPASPISSQVTSSSSEAESEEQFYDWASSPARPRNLLPESSPVRQPMSIRRDATLNTSRQEKLLGDPSRTGSKEDSQLFGHDTGHARSTFEISAPGLALPDEPATSNADTVSKVILPTRDSAENADKSGNVEGQGLPASTGGQKADPTLSGPGEGSCTNSDISASAGEQSENEHPPDDASDDDSEMENSVPFALGESLPPTQCSQAEQEPTGSAQPPSQLNEDHVQVAVTPVVINNGPQVNTEINRENPRSACLPFSSQSNKHSSQSRVPNTYPYPGSPEKSQSFDDPTTSSSLRSGGIASQTEIAVPQTQSQTQSSGTTSHSQSTYDPSTNEVVLESSDTSQRRHDILPLGSNTPAELLNDPFAGSADLVSSQLQNPTHEPMTQLSIDEPISSLQASSTRQFTSVAASLHHSPPKSPPHMTEQISQISQTTPATQSAELVARRLGFISGLEKSAEVQAIFKKFCCDYPGYTGDYGHFTELCSKLQAVRAQGLLGRSNLWDDFIIMHLEQYPSYLENCASESTEPLSWENYFISHFSKSIHRKRSLSSYSIEVAASQFAQPEVIPSQASGEADLSSQTEQGEAVNTSLATSFVDRFSNFHAHSFEEPVKHGLPVFQHGLPALASRMTSSSQTHIDSSSTLVKLEGSEMDLDGVLCTQPASIDFLGDISALYNHQPDITERQPLDSHSANVPDEQDDVVMAGLEETRQHSESPSADAPEQDDAGMAEVEETDDTDLHADDARHEMDPNEVLCTQPDPIDLLHDISSLFHPQPDIAERQPSESQSVNATDEHDDVVMAGFEETRQPSESQNTNAPEQDDVGMAEVEETDDEEFDPDDTRHETASVELGDDTFISTISRSHADEIAETRPESGDEDDEENWFVSLRHIRSKAEPVWSDHPTTPFKTWAEADQNVLSERRRRGGSKILLDEKGVILRPVRR